ncbi:hypothetical protein [Paraburkholderia caballeronis]|uniref:Uncharacterized protein n=1 Tax=Paraburkholderia caballeronis TaxID=416943 RepID=A0A1H7N174_9BURK|nr:hypothetical protein [Paraburkholderia caballeronis]PXW26317.1 hypothetical protein C7403_104189 [Paraburkholderia caballeronis]PXX01864.1 hypothetical protein C7407_104189 [Paraburkholderia caballeronis]RAK01021.1 hypothetical protein C7409_104189 [Paraburkholderia caballeronis]SEC02415.1 hypothetical protein SAMN05445871_1505 [Paraburkholderia caballeronis]SEL17174.1 hypothetical protein SAMN05192542_105280 [Paraburkholderia caballeronis]
MRATDTRSGTIDLNLRNLWFQAYIAALHRAEPVSAGMIADDAVRVAINRWKVLPNTTSPAESPGPVR